ncbi:hypothetical protein [Streptomyces paludis]|uniref:Uncharacterized protein n=1 Tax=Streptomyces paludis TaxID=2282738 RepID=A0A345HUV0_9ACTN|nr:hypothetical protein [Streptomyces paludis]AXG80474.1 hypothetical protein DVK44_25515 [Streptomyces paludis]
MYAYELHQIRSAELLREAADRRLVREVRRAGKQARRAARRPAANAPEGQASPPRDRFGHAA